MQMLQMEQSFEKSASNEEMPKHKVCDTLLLQKFFQSSKGKLDLHQQSVTPKVTSTVTFAVLAFIIWVV